jgi:hypothetical protein
MKAEKFDFEELNCLLEAEGFYCSMSGDGLKGIDQ